MVKYRNKPIVLSTKPEPQTRMDEIKKRLPKYRRRMWTKVYDYYLKPVLNFLGLSLEASVQGRCTAIKYIGSENENGRPTYLTVSRYSKELKQNIQKVYVIAMNAEEFLVYRQKRKDEYYEYFNPFLKPKQMMMLLFATVPIVYERYCITEDEDEPENIADFLVNEEFGYTNDDIAKHVLLKQLPSLPNDDGDLVYKFAMKLIQDTGDSIVVEAESINKSCAIMLLMLKLIDLLDGDGINEDEEVYIKIEEEMRDLAEKYKKECDLNCKDAIKYLGTKEVIEDYIGDVNYAQSEEIPIEKVEKAPKNVEFTDKTGMKTDDWYEDGKVIPVGNGLETDDDWFDDKVEYC